ncbi:hypothetical protein [uncultured Paludibaculum sp.]|uniref:hypothetical protein n=1 Tax=uncultured Paludibaculum sp. TaxID=1765020 RepID=UPI002AAB909A|nr:hypothetical protein [uncultured Paludibaculum sp.]
MWTWTKKCSIAPAVLATVIQTCSFAADWNPRLAADYLDARQKEWFAWAPAKSMGGPCLSCHTGITYLMARPPLRQVLGEGEPVEHETGLLNALRARVDKNEAKEYAPRITKEPMASQAIGVEAIFAALFLARADEPSGTMSPATRQAFDRLWRLQQKTGPLQGAWQWYVFNTDPYETSDSPFFGATLAALAVGSAPASYREQEPVKEHTAALKAYFARASAGQPLHNRLMLLWAARKLPGLLPDAAKKAIVEEALGKQNRDGSWSAESLGPWKEHPDAKLAPGANGYATAFAAFLLQTGGVPASDRRMSSALAWLRAHQDPRAGYWDSGSMNKQYPADAMPALFMRDAATSFAVLALTFAEPTAKR